MESQRINFYLNEYQLARALTTLRFLDPTYKPDTIHQMIKTICIDYCAKFNIGRSDTIPPEIWSELRKMLPATPCKLSMISSLSRALLPPKLRFCSPSNPTSLAA